MCKKSSCVVPVILLVIICLLCCYIVFFTECKDKKIKTDDTEKSENVINNNYTYDNIAGHYKFTESNNNQEFNFGYYLYLWKNGTFKYQFTMNTASSFIGNYIIVGDEIHLNYLFVGGSDAAVTTTSGEKVLKISDINTITDNDAHFYTNGGSKTINLVKDNSNNDNFNGFDVNNIINNYYIINNTNRNN